MRLLAFIEYAAVAAGIVAMLAGQFFALPKGFHFGVFLAGAGIALGGLEGLATRRMPFRPADDASEPYAGAPALIVGLMALLIGGLVIGAAYLLAEGRWHTTVSALTRRPAPLLIAAGLLLAGAGVLMMLNPQGRRGIAWALFIYLPRSLAGLVLVAAGLVAFWLAAWDWVDPAAFARFVGQLPRRLDWRRML